jgi:membrane protein required for colicin V production
MEVNPELQAVAGSPLWQAVFISFAVVLILFEVVRGWRLGLLRQLVRVAALAAAYAAAVFGGRLLVPIARPFLKMPDIVLSILAGAVLALVIYAFVTSMGMVLFKRTGQQNSKLVQLIYGFAGAIVGLFLGVFILWAIVASVRAVGAVADAQVRSRASSPEAGQSATLRALAVRRRFLSEPNTGSTALATSLARLKNSLELGPLGNAVKQTDPVPLKTYEMLGKVGWVFSSPERAQKFLTFPGARELSEHPKIVALRDDPEISEMIAQGRFLDLIQDQRLIDAANDPALANRIKKFDLQRALDYAVEQK